MQAAAQGLPLPNEIGYAFFITYTLCASSIGFAAMMLFAKSKRYRALGKVTFSAAVFGISEPLVFGTPLVLNFTFAFPFIFANGIVLLIAYLATHFGLIAPLMGVTPVFGLPVGFHAAIQGNIGAVIMQLMTQVIGALIYLPFFKRADHQALEEENEKDQEVMLNA